jgi:hypothetical protein
MGGRRREWEEEEDKGDEPLFTWLLDSSLITSMEKLYLQRISMHVWIRA